MQKEKKPNNINLSIDVSSIEKWKYFLKWFEEYPHSIQLKYLDVEK